MTVPLKYDVAVAAVATARTVDEVRDWDNKAAAMLEYARRIRDRSVEIDMAEIKARCRRRRGEILRELKTAGLLREGKPPRETVIEPGQLPPVTLEDLDITRNESSDAQRVAGIAGDAFERLIARCRAHMAENPKAHTIDPLRAPGEHVSNARAQMASRLEIKGDLDFYPTPLWGTRALFEHVLPSIGVKEVESAWEPACGQGHMSTVLVEYVKGKVVASDIFDYSGGDPKLAPPGWWMEADFLKAGKSTLPAVDWIITNPPFDSAALEFALRALELAQVGVAIFVPLRWLETIDRYERLFKPTPPTVVAPFVERINLCKGRWEPEGGTATAYVWIVWKHKAKPRPLFWIPPGCRQALTRPNDAAEWGFEIPPTDGAGEPINHDPATGEVAA
ncbi:MAG: hypothetical protein Q8M26_08835 [Pseudolabrys sp.]|nr:hypothetical protein [Pseudolabrys sp.]